MTQAMLTRRALVASAAVLAALPARAQGLPEAFPRRPITFMAPFTPGGPVDALARILAQGVQARGAPAASVENRSGGAGTIGIDLVRRAAPDGATLLVIPAGNLTINPSFIPNIGYDVERDFAPVTMMATAPNLIVAQAGSALRTPADLIAAARARPGSISYGSPGVGSQLHLAMELLRAKADIELIHVPYRGTTQALTDLLGGRIQLLVSNLPVVLPGVREGRLQALAMTTAQRIPQLPNVPTLAESGFPDIDVTSWYGLLAPKATPPATVRALFEVVEAVLRAPETERLIANQGMVVVAEPPEIVAARIRRESAIWAEVIRTRRITPD
jgi:tripartite-type tricarboxylate transporter receptor subunit TctC